MNHLIALFNSFQAYSKSNPVMAGAVGLWGLSVVTWFCRNLPKSIWTHVKRQCTTSLVFTNNSTGGNLDNFASFMEWFNTNALTKYSRTIQIDGCYHESAGSDTRMAGYVVGMGEGTHFFRYKGHFFWLKRAIMAQGSAYQGTQYQITITTLGRNRTVFMDLIEDFRYRPPKNAMGVYTFNSDGWKRVADIGKRGLKTVIINRDLKNRLLQIVDEYKVSRDWYINKGLPYKMTIILEGLPGTGKTSLIKALASHYGMNLCIINLNMMTDNGLEHALNTAPDNCMLVMEDFDSVDAVHARDGVDHTRNTRVEKVKEAPAPTPLSPNNSGTLTSATITAAPPQVKFDLMSGCLTLTGILNALDGIMSLDDKLIFMTTNRMKVLDEAMIRKGRVDHIFELGMLRHAEICEYIQLMFPGQDYLPVQEFAPILGCDIQALYFDHQRSVDDFVAALPRIKFGDWRDYVIPSKVRMGAGSQGG